ncbi:glutathione S-transferase family protein [Variovorax ureilyticus]|uniref:glutathione S-transferase family protein n=1 Tax=Variovorax ureilyticus TaxID=1836198 RepID=UPI003D670DB1
MQLVGMLDSPFVRRTAISLQLLGLPFESRPISVFRQVEEFRRFNPVVKAPTLVLADGMALMDSNLILQHAEALAGPARSLWPAATGEHTRALRLTGLALAACEKAVQLVYERELRPLERRHAPWTERVHSQMLAAWKQLEAELGKGALPRAAGGQPIDQSGLTIAVAWHFTQQLLRGALSERDFPHQAAHSEGAEALPAFAAWPHA